MSMFDSMDYKEFVLDQIKRNEEIRGYQSKLAEAARCQKSYFSHVLHSHHHLSQDQAMGLAIFWNLTSDETDWLLELLNLARAETEPLKRKIRERLKDLKTKRENLAEKFKKPRISASDKEYAYYSSWHWSAIHIITSIPTFRKVEAISERLNLPRDFVRECLKKLELMGLVKSVGSEWRIIPGGLYIPRESFLSSSHHANWRQRAVMDAQRQAGDVIHYTDIASHSFGDYEKIKMILLDVIDKTRKIVKPSKEEEISCLCLDFFRG